MHMHHLKKQQLRPFADWNRSFTGPIRTRRERRRPRRFWVRPGRTTVWWDNFVAGIVVEEEWKENFRLSRGSLQ